MENSNIKIRFIEEIDIDKVNDFHNRLHHDDRTKSEFEWEFHNAPAGKAIYIVAEDIDKNRIVGTQSAIPVLLRGTNDKTILSAKSEDTLVDPDYRGMQIFEKMYELLFNQCQKQGIRYIWGFTSALKPFRKIGFETPFSHSQSLHVLKIKSSYKYLSKLNPKNSLADKIKIFSLAGLSKIKALTTHFKSHAINNIKVITSSRVNSNLNELIDSMISNYDDCFTFDEDSSYVDWRINNNPYHNKILSVDFLDKNRLIGNVIFNYHTDGVWYLIQALFNDKLPDNFKLNVINSSLKKLIEIESPVLIRAWNFKTNKINNLEIKLLQKAGFVFLSRGVYFVWKDLKGTHELNPNSFILSRIASQGVI